MRQRDQLMSASILAVGMATALGLDWPTSCAASRAGIRRALRLDYFPVQGLHAGDVQLCAAHSVELLTRGFEGYGRLVRLLSGAMRDLKNQHQKLEEWSSESLYMALPDFQAGLSHATENGAVAILSPYSLVDSAARLAGWPQTPPLAFFSTAGQAGVTQVIDTALRDLSNGTTCRAIIGAVDSLLDADSLSALLLAGRLKHSGVAAGLIPGEAGVLILLNKARSSRDLGRIQATAICRDEKSGREGEVSWGEGLLDVMAGLQTEEKNWPADDVPWIVSDQNGEPGRASEWGHALVRLRRKTASFAKAAFLLPAMAFGDTRAASSALGIGLVTAAWRRGYAVSTRCAVIAASDGALRAGILLSAPEVSRG